MKRSLAILGLLLASCTRDERPAPPAAPSKRPAASSPAPGPAPEPAPNWGEPDLKKLRRLFKARSSEIRSCYESALQREPTTSGRLVLRFTLAPGGGIEDVSFSGSTFRRSEVPRCIADVVRRWRTPFRPSEPVAVEYPLRFTPL